MLRSNLLLLGVEQYNWNTTAANKICEESRIIPNIPIASMCQHKCEIDEYCKGISYPKFNGYVHDCYLCYGDSLANVTENLIEAEMEFKRRPSGTFINQISFFIICKIHRTNILVTLSYNL